MFDKVEKIAIIVILAVLVWTIVKPTIIDQNKINQIVKVIQQHQKVIQQYQTDINLLKQNLIKPELPK